MSNTEQLFWLFRCTEYQYAKSFIDNGCIKLSTPKTWIELGKSKGHGRGDSLEGVFAAINYLDFKKSITFQATRNNIICSPGQGIIYFSSKNIQNIPCYCLFGLTNTAFEKR
ncbi:MAG: hypothetical protein Q8T08_11485, partial [Ignavibacteria bacterium]|nr:hypothetical protein [Ignavibacteria bacterium]